VRKGFPSLAINARRTACWILPTLRFFIAANIGPYALEGQGRLLLRSFSAKQRTGEG
jgi:hypothetical protein